MAPFPDNLPPEGLDAIYKLLIYYGLVFVFATAITSWLITRRRSFPKAKIIESTASTVQTNSTVTDTLNFENTADRLASLIVEEKGHESAIGKLNELSDQLENRTFDKINIHYQDRLADIKMEIDAIQDSMAGPQEDVESSDADSIDEDLEKQLLDLEQDDTFLKPRRKKTMEEIFDNEPSTPSPTPVTTPVATAPPPQTKVTPIPAPPAKKTVSMPPAPTTTEAKPAATPPAPMKSETKSAPAPPAPAKKASPPPPPGKSASLPQASPPRANVPTASEPLSAAQPMKVQSEGDDAMFAKSTSIAALRMDMLRELARLKKLIPEDQEKE